MASSLLYRHHVVLDCPRTLWKRGTAALRGPGGLCESEKKKPLEILWQPQVNWKERKQRGQAVPTGLDKAGLLPGKSLRSFHNHFLLGRRKTFTNLYDFELFYNWSNLTTQKEYMVFLTKDKVRNSCLHSVTFCNRRYTWAEESLSTWNLQRKRQRLEERDSHVLGHLHRKHPIPRRYSLGLLRKQSPSPKGGPAPWGGTVNWRAMQLEWPWAKMSQILNMTTSQEEGNFQW